MQLTIKTLAGLEPLLAQELKTLGAKSTAPGQRVVQAEGDKLLLYRANLELRTALRVLVPIAEFEAASEQDLYRSVQTVDWGQYLGAGHTLAVDAVTSGPVFRHSHYAALKTKDAVVDQFRSRSGRRPSVDIKDPTLRINLHIKDTQCTLSLDSSGDSLHKRGYRGRGGPAPLNEVLAAGMLLQAGYSGRRPLLDPMCGSGTLLAEAALIACQQPPQWHRTRFGFLRWRDAELDLWESVREKAATRIRPPQNPIFGRDRHPRAIGLSRSNLGKAGILRWVQLEAADFLQAPAPAPEGLLIMNPPYDERIPQEEVEDFYQQIGDRLKQAYTGWEAWLISAHKGAVKRIGLRASQRTTLYNGPLACKYLKYELYAGSKKRD